MLINILVIRMYVKMTYRIAGNFRGVMYSLFSWASWPPQITQAWLTGTQECRQATRLNEIFTHENHRFSIKLNDFLPHENYPLYTVYTCIVIQIHHLIKRAKKWRNKQDWTVHTEHGDLHGEPGSYLISLLVITAHFHVEEKFGEYGSKTQHFRQYTARYITLYNVYISVCLDI